MSKKVDKSISSGPNLFNSVELLKPSRFKIGDLIEINSRYYWNDELKIGDLGIVLGASLKPGYGSQILTYFPNQRSVDYIWFDIEDPYLIVRTFMRRFDKDFDIPPNSC